MKYTLYSLIILAVLAISTPAFAMSYYYPANNYGYGNSGYGGYGYGHGYDGWYQPTNYGYGYSNYTPNRYSYQPANYGYGTGYGGGYGGGTFNNSNVYNGQPFNYTRYGNSYNNYNDANDWTEININEGNTTDYTSYFLEYGGVAPQQNSRIYDYYYSRYMQ